MGFYQNQLIEMEEKFGSILDEVIKRNSCVEDVFEEMQEHRYLISNQGFFYGVNDEEYFTEGIELAWEEYQAKYYENAQGSE
tara:strand:- start:40 stop:285 length:246 start_codon:yes stop_codon:yes gene_type:complete